MSMYAKRTLSVMCSDIVKVRDDLDSLDLEFENFLSVLVDSGENTLSWKDNWLESGIRD